MTTILERIEIAGPDHRARRLVFSGGVEPRVTSAAVVRALGLEEGGAADLDELEIALEHAESQCGRERALRLLGYRERSTRELVRRLADDGYPDAVVERIVSRLCELGLVDDLRFAQLYARGRMAAGYGSRRIVAELREKGLDPETAARVLAEVVEDEAIDPETDRARKALGGAVPRSRKERDRALRRLLQRGYDMRTALEALDGASDDE